MNVEEAFHFIADKQETNEADHPAQRRQSVPEAFNMSESAKIVEELKDWGSERRHKQLFSVCEQHGLLHLPKQALGATRQRLTQETKLGVLKKPGAYYQKILLKLLSDLQVFVPTLAEKSDDDPEEVRHIVRASLGLPPE